MKKQHRHRSTIMWRMLMGIILMPMSAIARMEHSPPLLLNQQMVQLQGQLQHAQQACVISKKLARSAGIVSYGIQPIHPVVLSSMLSSSACQRVPILTKKLHTLSTLYLLWQRQAQRKKTLSSQSHHE